jgi:hypothetical protein
MKDYIASDLRREAACDREEVDFTFYTEQTLFDNFGYCFKFYEDNDEES